MKEIIEESITELIDDYKDNEFSYLTESDVTAKLFHILRTKLDRDSVHLELRPYKHTSEVLSGKPKAWSKTGVGSTIDLVIIDTSYLGKALRLKSRKYWRFLSFPVEAFRVAIEVKIRVSGNIRKNAKKGILSDILKLSLIREANRDCFAYIVLLDRRASQSNLQKAHDFAIARGVEFFSFPSLVVKNSNRWS